MDQRKKENDVSKEEEENERKEKEEEEEKKPVPIFQELTLAQIAFGITLSTYVSR